MHGYGIAPRRPLLPLGKNQGEEFMVVLNDMILLEREMMRKAEESAQ